MTEYAFWSDDWWPTRRPTGLSATSLEAAANFAQQYPYFIVFLTDKHPLSTIETNPDPRRSTMIQVNESTEIQTPAIISFDGVLSDTSFDGVSTRPFDADKGDERRFLREEAIALAQLRTRDRGVRQVVRQNDRPHGDDHLIPRWLIQDI